VLKRERERERERAKTQGERGRVKRGLSLGVSNVVVRAARETVGLFTARKNT
jgi:hypothetical protein